MKTEDALNFVKELQYACKSNSALAFTFEEHHSTDLFRRIFRKEIPAPGISKKSGVYFITTDLNEILYIGKATCENMGPEIYGKFGSATINEDLPTFERSKLAAWAPTEELKKLLKSGDVRLVAITIEPPAISSMIEVYLQTHCSLGRDRKLPPLNKQIG